MKKILIAGGLCGSTMLMAAEKIQERCDRADLSVTVKIHNLWEGGGDNFKGYDLIIEMFPYFEHMDCPVISGKPFISHIGEKPLLADIMNLLQH